jgi:hypothetical protein
MLADAKRRGWQVWIFQANARAGRGGSGHILEDERTQAAFSARIVGLRDRAAPHELSLVHLQ